jgi:hypothetical protein
MKEYELSPGDSLNNKFYAIWFAMAGSQSQEPATFTHNGTRIIMFPDRDGFASQEPKIPSLKGRVVLVPEGMEIHIYKPRKKKPLSDAKNPTEQKK